MSLATVARAEAKLLLPTYDRQRVLFERGRGVYLWDSKGKRYLDFLSGIGVNALGHAHPVIQSTLKRQAGRLIHVSNLFFHEFQAELAKRLTKISGLDKAFFCNSGTEAWEGALKLARAFARTQNNNGHKAKWRLLALENSFHGRTFGSLATTGQEKYRHPFRRWCRELDLSASTMLTISNGNLMAAFARFVWRRFRAKAESVRSVLSSCRLRGSCVIAPARC